ncbi:5-carboxymethyl-2-hydroxymuconate semialdehyde dehydrogenase [Deinococcus radiophilus]|uniref:5-carboxymethyl-2-hydroxymuconate semialdehyde dehydrogenase n=1 Tax=Deinococcus radiophilus TaxID=32062 RepID=A0A431VS96_9DEIO|nr:5-carboxymethyl-2-hydroxymuconate semialdehyde dehydrogenase [Deinococcus radiophilus]RTR26021.1 5-carboxymethyl-2-hydroxymuconate semialdehyde dehydrogenase [Deinococcus radiophilus]UFA51865.1 5-carboxymethyl-2-hydroxymuconate semialdehyde dehydrogenase [Deinococcus radiophilus]
MTQPSPEHAANRQLADQLRAERLSKGIQHFIGGEWVDAVSGQTFEANSPVDNAPLVTVARGDERDIDRAAQAAHDAFQEWRLLPGKERRAVLHRIADLIEKRSQEIAVLESLDTGQAIRFMKSAAARGAENFRFFADRAPAAQDGQSLPAPGFVNYSIRQPIGPVGVITPWNTPFMLSTWKIAPALAAGCTVVHKPAEWSPVSATLLAEIMDEAGLPKGVHNLVHGFGEDAGKSLTEHPLIKAVAFVGETTTGSHIMRQGADTLKRVHFELGGKNAVVVFDDADLDKALDAVVFMIYSLNGERCTSSSRVLIQEGIYDEFTARIAERAGNIRVGDPLDPATEVGPLVHPRHFEKVCSYFEKAREEGATIAVGGEKVGDTGNFVRPTLFTGARNDMQIAQEEIFGPVLTAIPFKDEAEALQLANGVRYGLAGYLWTSDVTRAHRFAQGMEAGMIWVNSENVRHLPTPFGGVKDSGIGRDGGDYSFEFYMETKNIAVSLGTHKTAQLGVGKAPAIAPKEAGE